ncbi:MAG TPA: CPBP family intramembrane glutamic endopeptidase [Terriglobales bacterium]|nr:CPBP family intramembrane glutamic endopeptidase [Terriglobales bacterium]
MRELFRRHPLPLFFLLAFSGFWACLALDRVPRLHYWVPFLGVFAPAVAAIIVTGMSDGESGIRRLMQRLGRWRVRPQWYAIAIGLPIMQALIATTVAVLLHKYKGLSLDALRPILPSMWVVFIFATGEELGWRGFALPHLLARYRAVYASLILGTLHSVWHWPLILLPHGLMSDLPLLPWTAAVLAEAIVFTWIFQNTGGSVLLAVLFHGTVNNSMLLFDAIDATWMPWIKSGICVVTGVAVLLAAGPDLTRKERPLPSVSASATR